MSIDLHLHTTASDGELTPTQVITLARKRGMEIIAITDHDTTDGLAEAISVAQVRTQAGEPLSHPIVLPGIELSAEDESGDVHMLGYFRDLASTEQPALQDKLVKFRADRADRAQKIVEKLAQIGVPVAWERVQAFAEKGSKRGAIGRPHIARALVEAGYVDSVRGAFALYLNNDAPAYVSRQRLSPEEAIELIHSVGGVAVLAHPGKLKDYVAMTHRLVPAGLDGVEVIHPANNENTRLDLRALAKKYDLLETGGSDFHGVSDDGSYSLGTFNPSISTYQAIRERAEKYQTAP